MDYYNQQRRHSFNSGIPFSAAEEDHRIQFGIS